jgi:hypothetical protein
VINQGLRDGGGPTKCVMLWKKLLKPIKKSVHWVNKQPCTYIWPHIRSQTHLKQIKKQTKDGAKKRMVMHAISLKYSSKIDMLFSLPIF